MRGIMKLVSAIIVTTFVFSSFLTVAAAKDEWVEIPPSDTYLNYLAHPDDYPLAPPYYSASQVDNQEKPKGVPKASHTVILPEKYTVMEDGITPLVKNQATDATCSLFAMLGNYEILAAKNNDIRYFSEFHAKHAIAQRFSDGLNPYGPDRNPSEGLYLRWISPYLMNGKGPVDISFSNYITGDGLVASNYINSVKPAIQTQEIQTFPEISTSASNQVFEQWLNELKSLVYQYGSVAITMTSNPYYTDISGSYFYCSELPEYHDHAVVCVGWDDTIPASSFTNRYNETPSRDGGLIIKNSWTNTWGDSGYGYVSYDSKGLSMQESQIITKYRSRRSDEKVNTYSELGANSIAGINTTQSQWFGNKFYLNRGEHVNLKEVSFYAPISDIRYDVYVNPTGEVNYDKLRLMGSITPEYPGYYSVPVNIELGSDDFSEYFVVVKSNCGSAFYAVPIEGTANTFSNICSRYIYYIDGNQRVILPYSTENTSMVEDLGFDWATLSTGYISADSRSFSTYSFSNIVVNTVTEPIEHDVELSVSVQTPNSAIIHEPVSISAEAAGNGSGDYSYIYKIFRNSKLVDEISGSSEFSFVPDKIGEYYVEVTVTDNVYDVAATGSTGVFGVNYPDFAVDFSISQNDGKLEITGGAENSLGDVKYYVYVMKGGSIVYTYSCDCYINCSFDIDGKGTYTARVYAQDCTNDRISCSHSIRVF